MNNDILKIYEFKEKIIQEINNVKLPAVIIKFILKELLSEIERIELQQYNEVKSHKEQLKQDKEGEKENE